MWNIGKRCPVQTNRPPKRRKHKLKKNKHKRNIFSASKHRKMKTSKWICTKDDLKDWLIPSGTQTHNKQREHTKKRKEKLKNFPDWKRENEKKLTRHSEKNKKKEGKGLPISNIYFYILIYQNKKIKRKQNMNGEGKYQKRTDARRHLFSWQFPRQSLQPCHSTPLHRQTPDTPTQGCSRNKAEQGIDNKIPD